MWQADNTPRHRISDISMGAALATGIILLFAFHGYIFGNISASPPCSMMPSVIPTVEPVANVATFSSDVQITTLFGERLGQVLGTLELLSKLPALPVMPTTANGLPLFSYPVLQFPPECKQLIINVGASVDPLVATRVDTCTLAVEPLIREINKIPENPRVLRLCAAVSENFGLATILWYGTSSSMSNRTIHSAPGYIQWAPTIPLQAILRAIPPSLTIALLKIDTQGWDSRILTATPAALFERVEAIQSELYCPGYTLYEGLTNQYAPINTWLQSLGFVPAAAGGATHLVGGKELSMTDPCTTPDPDTHGEFDARWVRRGCVGIYCSIEPRLWKTQ